MVNYYHTSKYLFAVANGRISSVIGVDGGECPVNVIGAKLIGVVDDHLKLLENAEISLGLRLKFDLGGGCLITDRIILIESVNSFSIPPAPRQSLPPESGGRVLAVTLPEILLQEVPFTETDE